jgi:hypothetical protein
MSTILLYHGWGVRGYPHLLPRGCGSTGNPTGLR